MGSSPTDRIVSPVVQLVERVAVNHYVVGSSPTRGVVENPRSLLGSVPDTYESRMARVSMNDPICTIKNTRAAYLSVITQGTQSVAQFGSALRLGRKGRRFESCHSDFGPVTQLGEYFVCIEKVAGSSPVRSTKNTKKIGVLNSFSP